MNDLMKREINYELDICDCCAGKLEIVHLAEDETEMNKIECIKCFWSDEDFDLETLIERNRA